MDILKVYFQYYINKFVNITWFIVSTSIILYLFVPFLVFKFVFNDDYTQLRTNSSYEINFRTIQNNTALKLKGNFINWLNNFRTIQNNTALKLRFNRTSLLIDFGTIQNNTALKLVSFEYLIFVNFGTIQNNTALKLRNAYKSTFRNFGTIQNNTALKRIH